MRVALWSVVPTLRAHCLYDPNFNGGSAHIAVDLAGEPIECRDEEFAVTVKFPELQADGMILESGYPGCVVREGADTAGPLRREDLVALLPKCLEVWADCTVDTVDDAARQHATSALDVIAAVVTRLMDRLRIGQPWAGPTGVPPHLLNATLTVVETGQTLLFTEPPQHGRHATVIGGPYLSVEEAKAAIAGEIPEPHELLLADAAYSTFHAPHVRPSQGVLLAAMSCETHAKVTLRQVAPAQLSPLLSTLLDNPRAFPHAARDLFHSVAKAITSRSVRDDDQELWKNICRLFERRNAVAHRLESIDKAEAVGLVRAAIAATRWLDEIAEQEAEAPQ